MNALRLSALILSLAVSACVSSEPVGGDDPDRADDLVGRDVEVVAARTMDVEFGTFETRPHLTEHWDNSITIETDAFIARPSAERGLSVQLPTTFESGSHYGFVLEYRDAASSDRWLPFMLVEGDPTAVISDVFVQDRPTEDNRWMFVAVGQSSRESFFGQLAPEVDLVERTFEVTAESLELRVMPIPAWNWGDWDEDYRFDIEFVPLWD